MSEVVEETQKEILKTAESKRKKSIGFRLKRAREATDMNQSELANRLGVSRAAVSQWELGGVSPSYARLAEVAKILNVSPEFLSFGKVEKPPEIDERTQVPVGTYFLEDGNFEFDQTGEWAIPGGWLKSIRARSLDTIKLVEIQSDEFGPEIEYGDLVLTDTSNKAPSGLTVYWNGVNAVVGKITVTPIGEARVQLKPVVESPDDTFECPVGKLRVIGRVLSIIKTP